MLYGQNYNQAAYGQTYQQQPQQQQPAAIGLNAVQQVLGMLEPAEISHICNTMGINNPALIYQTLLTWNPTDQAYVLGLLGTMYDTKLRRQQAQQQQLGRPAMPVNPQYPPNIQQNAQQQQFQRPNPPLYKPSINAGMPASGQTIPSNAGPAKRATGSPAIPVKQVSQPNNLYNPHGVTKQDIPETKLVPYRGSEYEPLVVDGKEVIKTNDSRYYEYKIKGEGTSMDTIGKINMAVIDGGVTNDTMPDSGNKVDPETEEAIGIISNDNFGLNKSLNHTFTGNYLRLVARERKLGVVAVDALTLNSIIVPVNFKLDSWYDILNNSKDVFDIWTGINNILRDKYKVLLPYGKALDKIITRKINERFRYDIIAGMQLSSFLDDLPALDKMLKEKLVDTPRGLNITAVLNKVFKNLKFDTNIAQSSKDEIEQSLTVMQEYKEVAVPEYVTIIYTTEPTIKTSLDAAYDKVEGVKTFQITNESHPIFYEALEYIRGKSRFNHGSSAAVLTDDANYRVFYSEYGYYTITKL